MFKPHLADANVLTPLEAICALEVLGAKPGRPLYPVDHSLMAFFVSRWKGLKYLDIRDVRAPQTFTHYIAQLRIWLIYRMLLK